MFSRAFPLFVAAGLALLPPAVRGDIFSVTNTADDGPGSFRQAILDANAHPNASASNRDQIHFAIPGTDIQSIYPMFPLPEITDPVVVDGFTQNGALPNSNPVGQGLNPTFGIELDGNILFLEGDGLTITCGNTTVRGLIISRFESGIRCRGGSGNIIEGNFIGTDRTGTFAPRNLNFGRNPQQSFGVFLENCAGSRIGGREPGARNLISGGYYADVYILGPAATGNVVEGNLMGTKASGMASLILGSASGVTLADGASANLIGGTVIEARNVLSSSESTGGNYVGVNVVFTLFPPLAAPFANQIKGNFFGLNVLGTGVINSDADPTGYGVILAGHDNVVGGTEPGARNVISGNQNAGVSLGWDTATGNLVQGNFIGTDESGTQPLGNGAGVQILHLASNNTIGGIAPGAGNRVAFTTAGPFTGPSAGAGIVVYPGFENSGTGNAILGNSIYGNQKIGIDLAADEVTPNDSGDTDNGPNNLQNYPVLGSADFENGGVRIRGALNSAADQSYRIEFFGDTSTDKSMFGEGKIFIEAANVVTGGDGTAAFDLALPGPAGIRTVSATATDSSGNTSEFSGALFIAGTPGPQLLNISTRLGVQTGDNALIGGFIITGVDSKKVMIRGIGPSLESSFSGSLADPTLELFRGGTFLASNDNWRDSQQAEIEATGIAPNHALEAAIVRSLPPGTYTAVMRGHNDTTGIGLVEVYDLDQSVISELANISTRGLVGTGDNVLIGGLIMGPAGVGGKTVVRAIGPTLGDFGIDGALQDPTLDLVNSDGAIIRSNNDWRDMQQVEIEAVGLEPGDDRESALVEIIPPGNYTAIVRGAGNTTGVALVEVYHLP